MSYQIKRVDRNQVEIVKLLRKLGVTVRVTSQVGQGFPDLVISYAGRTYLVELKDGEKPPSLQRLTECEEKFHQSWQDKVYIINSAESAIEFFNGIKSKNESQ